MRCGRTKWSHHFEDLQKGRPYFFQVRAANNEGFGPWSAPSDPVWTLTRRPDPPPAPRIAFSRPPPGPLSLWLSIVFPNDDGGDPISAVLLETREHSGARAPEWSRCERHPVLPPIGDQHHFADSTVSDRADVGGAASLGGGAAGGNSFGWNTLGERSGCTTKCLQTKDVIVRVGGLKPRTHYSFRASAVNGKGAGDPGPPCRRVRTSPPRPPSWSPMETIAYPAKQTLSGAESEDHSVSEGGGLVRHAPPRAISCGHGACSVAWEEPFCNGAPIESYEVEFARLGAVVAVENPVVAPPALATTESRENRSDTSLGFQPPIKTMEPPPPQPQPIPQPPRVSVALVESGGEPREIMETAVRTVAAHMRVVSIKGLVTHGEYTFRVAGVNVMGRGEAGLWSAIVRIPDPND